MIVYVVVCWKKFGLDYLKVEVFGDKKSAAEYALEHSKAGWDVEIYVRTVRSAPEPPVFSDRAIGDIINELEEHYSKLIEKSPTREEFKKCEEFQKRRGVKGWEISFCPEKWFYDDVLNLLTPDDVVFDVGAGDLRFALLASQKVRKVYAVEINPEILSYALKIIGFDMPTNIIAICANAWELELPSDVTTIVCLMIHRQHKFPESWLSRRIICSTHEGLEEYEGEVREVRASDSG